MLGKKSSPNKHPMYKLHSTGDKILFWSHVFWTSWFLPEPEGSVWYTTLFMMVLVNLTSVWYISLLYCVGAFFFFPNWSLFFPNKELKLYCCLIDHYSTTVLMTGPRLSSLPAISSPVLYLCWNNFYLLHSHLLNRLVQVHNHYPELMWEAESTKSNRKTNQRHRTGWHRPRQVIFTHTLFS